MEELMTDFVTDREGAEQAAVPDSLALTEKTQIQSEETAISKNQDDDSEHRGRLTAKEMNDESQNAAESRGEETTMTEELEQEHSEPSSSTSSPDNLARASSLGEDEEPGQHHDVNTHEEEARPTSTETEPPSPPPVPRHRHTPSAGAQRTFDNLLAAADRSSPSSTHRSTVIVAVVVLDGEGRVLLIQESKAKCRGRWYLPAGRVEVGESPLEGAMREVEEESGLQLEPSGVFSLEYKISKSSGKAWIRYGVTGQIVGGSLKTPDREDKESIQAQWFTLDEVTSSLSLRNDDVLKLIALYQQNGDRPIPVLSSYK